MRRIYQLLILFTGFAGSMLSLLLTNKGHLSILEEPLSTIGNVYNYPIFFIGGSICVIILNLIFLEIAREKGMHLETEALATVLFGVISFAIPYNKEFILSRIIHTSLAIFTVLLISHMIYRINKEYNVKNILKYTPQIGISGSFTIFLLTGINTMMQLFFILIGVLWLFFIPTKIKNHSKP